jgi:hypothetical protein
MNLDVWAIGGLIIAALALIGLGLSIALMMANESIRQRYEDDGEW